jgi:hypothetical protein
MVTTEHSEEEEQESGEGGGEQGAHRSKAGTRTVIRNLRENECASILTLKPKACKGSCAHPRIE